MNKITAAVSIAMMQENQGDPARIEHTLKVYGYAQTIGVLEDLHPELQQILEITALLHDIGIHISEQKYDSSAAKYQELEGPILAEKILRSMQLPQPMIDRVCYLISKHHTFSAIDGEDFQILIEADFLVNSVEDHMTNFQIRSFAEKYLKTHSGKHFLTMLFPHYFKE